MKYCIIVPDGAADYPVPRLDDKTPLAVANKPNMDRAAAEGLLGLTCHVPHRMPAGSSVAIMSLAGYDPVADYTGRAPLEAADLGLEMGPHDWAVRCNLITAADGNLADSNAGHISTEEATVLIDLLNEELGSEDVSFHVGTGYRHILLYRGEAALNCETNPPHDYVGEPIRELLPRGPGASVLTELMRQSTEVLAGHEVNEVRTDLGKNPANMIWLWGQGTVPRMDPFQDRYGLRGGCISAVNLVRGIGKIIGWKVIEVPGITGYTDTDYAAKGRYALDALNELDLVFIHIEAPDEASHDRDVQAKVRSIQAIDRDIVGPIMAQAEQDGDMRVLICPDHVTSVADGRHERDQVPFVIWGASVAAQSGHPFSEAAAAATDVRAEKGHHLMRDFLSV
jgi:2,3-bisphosphoglycerate-independent phosphoglycerate mutase